MRLNKLLFLAGLGVAVLALSACNYSGSLNLTVPPSGTESATESLTGTPAATGTAAATEASDRAGCGTNPANPPAALDALATEVGASQSDVLGYWCQGFGLGEIRVAYEIAQLSGKDVSSIFQMKTNGMGWGQIANQLNVRPAHMPPDNPGNGKGNGAGGPPSNPGKP